MDNDAAILALDPGGTKCHALLVRGDGRALSWGSSEGSGLSGRSEQAFLLAARRALARHVPESLTIISLGPRYIPKPAANVFINAYFKLARRLSIPGRPRPAAQVCRWLVRKLDIPIVAVILVKEDEAAMALAGQPYGLVVLAGTGSFVHGKTRDGRELHLDGIGPVLGDTGSAYFIGLMALRAAAKSDWHLRFHTTLLKRAYSFYGLRNVSELVTFSLKPKDRSVIAAFARVVDEEASAGDAVARRILLEAADELADIVQATSERLEMTGESYTMIGTGSVIMHSAIYWMRLCEQVQKFAPSLTPMRSPHPAVLGFALEALRLAQCPNYEQAADTLLATYQDVMKQGALNDISAVSG
ncbi:MAG: hypothetical protein HYV35_00125 [Lentisphaerae bacterium]|nr:hypothetical protein [Lentisphaerota bacterium]